MLVWAKHLQRYFVSNGADKISLKSAFVSCENSDIKNFLSDFSANKIKNIYDAESLASTLQKNGSRPEVALLRLILLLVAFPDSSREISQKQHIDISTSFVTLINACYLKPELQNTLATAYSLAADYYSSQKSSQDEQSYLTTSCETLRLLAETRRDPFANDLARMLFHLGILCQENGAISEAYAAFEESRDIYQKLILEGPNQNEYDLARVLSNLGSLKSIRGNSDDALKDITDAVAICRKLNLSPKTSRKDVLALTLNKLGNIFFRERDYDSAIRTYEEAKDLYVELSKTNYKHHAADLATAFNNLGAVHGYINEFGHAQIAFEKARDIRRPLAENGNARTKVDLSETLINLGTSYFRQKKYQESMVAFKETWDIRTRLAAENPKKYGHSLAKALKHLGANEQILGKYTDALQTQTQAHKMFKALEKADPGQHIANIAGTLNSLGGFYKSMRNFTESRDAYLEALPLHQVLVNKAPERHNHSLSTTYNNLGVVNQELRQFTQARFFYEKARDIRETLVAKNSKAYSPDYAMTLSNLGVLYRMLGDTELSLGAFTAAISIRRTLVDSHWQAHAPNLASTLNNLSNLLCATANFEGAIDAGKEAFDIYTKLAVSYRYTSSIELAKTLSNLSRTWFSMGQLDLALEKQLQSRDILVNLKTENNLERHNNLAGVFTNLGTLFEANQLPIDACENFKTALHHAEAKRFNDEELFLVKGKSLAAYRYLLSETHSDSVRAFALAAALRNGNLRSNEIEHDDLTATQEILAKIDKKVGAPNILMVPTTGSAVDTLTIGLISAKSCQWWVIPCKGWSKLLAENPNKAKHSNRHKLARLIWNSLPGVLRDAIIMTLPGTGDIYISGDTNWTAFPWELLRFGFETNDYLGLHKVLPRIQSINATSLIQVLDSKSIGSGSRDVAVIAPHTTNRDLLWGVLDEVETFKEQVPKSAGILTACKVGPDATDVSLRQAIISSPALLYFSGHGNVIENEEMLKLHSENSEGLKLYENTTYFGRYQLSELANNGHEETLFTNSPLIILNSCYSGRTHDHGGLSENLVQSFLDYGAETVIASALPMQDSIGKMLSQSLFNSATLSKPTIGAQIVSMRNQIKNIAGNDTSQPTWGAWGMVHLHGNSLAKSCFLKPSSHNTGN